MEPYTSAAGNTGCPAMGGNIVIWTKLKNAADFAASAIKAGHLLLWAEKTSGAVKLRYKDENGHTGTVQGEPAAWADITGKPDTYPAAWDGITGKPDLLSLSGGTMTGELLTAADNGFRMIDGNYGVFTRKDSSSFYIMVTAQGNPVGGFTAARPLRITLATGVCDINGTAQKAVADGDGNNIAATYVKKSANTAAAAMLMSLQAPAAARMIPFGDDASALTLSPLCPEWEAGAQYEAGDIVNRDGQAYRVVQAVTAQEHQPPESEGMLAVYRPLMPEHEGTKEDPIPYLDGMDVESGKYYSYDGKLYRAAADMPACVWPPGTDGVHQWEVATL